MILTTSLYLFASSSLSALPAGAVELTPPVVIAAPQGVGSVPGKGGGSLPSGGTPEPTGLLLLVGGALGVGAYWLKQGKKRAPKE
jgi:hypothetical protein